MGGWEGAVITAIGAFCGLAGALGYGFKKMVDVLGEELRSERVEMESIRTDIVGKLDKHMLECARDRQVCKCWKESGR